MAVDSTRKGKTLGSTRNGKHSKKVKSSTPTPLLTPSEERKLLSALSGQILCVPRKFKHSKKVKDNKPIPLLAPSEERKLPSVLSCMFQAAVAKVLSWKSDGEEAVWKKTILMGDKCRPLDFSGQINYDAEGNQLLKNSMAEEVSWGLGVGSPVRKNSYRIV